MSLLPKRYQNHLLHSVNLFGVKKGIAKDLSDFIWHYQEHFYVIAHLAFGNDETASELTVKAFKMAFQALQEENILTIVDTWAWLSQFIVRVCIHHYEETNSPKPTEASSDPHIDGSAQLDWETTIILGTQRVKRCLYQLDIDEQKVFILRHQLDLSFNQVASVLNKHPVDVLFLLFRARVQIIKCLGRG